MLPVTQAGIAQDYTQGKDTGEKGVFPRANQTVKKHFELMNYDSDAANAEIEANEATRKNAALEIEKRAAYLAEQGISEQDFSLDDEYMRLVREANRDTSERDAQLRREIKEAADYQKMQGYYALTGKPDFEQKSERTSENNRLDKAVYDEWYGDPHEYIDALNAAHRAEYEEILEKYGQAAADQYLATHITDKDGYQQYNLGELTDEERRIFNYILNTEGDGKAEEYLKFMAENLNYRKALREFQNVQKQSRAEQNLYGFFNAKEAGYDQFAQGLAGWLTDEEIPATSDMIENSLYNEAQGKWGRRIHSALTSGFNMLPSMIIGLANPTAGSVAFGISAGGNYRQEALKAGYTNEQATAYGILTGASEVALEKLIGGMAGLGGKGLSNAVKHIPGAKAAMVKISDALGRISIGKQTAARSVLKAIDSIGGEFADEYLQEILNPVFRNICLGEDNEFKPFTAEALEAGIVGALMAVSGNIAHVPGGVINAYTDSKNAYNTAHVRERVGTLIDNTASIGRAEVSKQRDILKSKLESGEKIDAGDVAAYTSTLTAEEIADGFGISMRSEYRTEADIRAQMGDDNAAAGALYRMQRGDFTERDVEAVKSSPNARKLFSEYFDTEITDNTGDGEIADAVRNVSDDSFREISYEAQNLLKSVRAHNGHTQNVDTAFYKAYFEGYNSTARTWDSDSAISDSASQTAYELGMQAKADIGTFRTVGGASLSSGTAALFSRAAKDLGVSITYGGKGSVANGGVRRGYFNSHNAIHIYEDAKVMQAGGRTLYGGEAATRIILGHEATHALKLRSPGQYKVFEQFVLEQRSDGQNNLDLVSEYMHTFRLSKQEATDEVVANYAMRVLFSDIKTARQITKRHSKLAEAIRNVFAWLREKLGIQSSDLDTAANLWNKAYNESKRNGQNGVANSAVTKYNGLKNSISQDEIGQIIDRLNSGEAVSVEEIYVVPEIRDAADAAKKIPFTDRIQTVERQHLRASVGDELLRLGSFTHLDESGNEVYDGTVKRERRADIVIGLPAAGKSSVIVLPLSKQFGSRVIDSDMAKERLPEFNGGIGANAVHEESKDIIKFVLDRAFGSGDNIVYPIVGSNIESVLKITERFRKNGYSVYLSLNELPGNKAMARMLGRFLSTGRFIPPEVVTGYGNEPTAVYEKIKNMEGIIDGYSRWSNDVKRGEQPIRLEESQSFRGDDGRGSGLGLSRRKEAAYAVGKVFEVQSKIENKKADSVESAFSNDGGNPDISYSNSSTDALDIDFERRINEARGAYSSLAETLRAKEDEARRAKREFLPDIETTNAVAAEHSAARSMAEQLADMEAASRNGGRRYTMSLDTFQRVANTYAGDVDEKTYSHFAKRLYNAAVKLAAAYHARGKAKTERYADAYIAMQDAAAVLERDRDTATDLAGEMTLAMLDAGYAGEASSKTARGRFMSAKQAAMDTALYSGREAERAHKPQISEEIRSRRLWMCSVMTYCQTAAKTRLLMCS